MEPEIASCSSTLTANKALTEEVDNKNKGKAIQLDSPSYDEQFEGYASDSYNIESSPVSNSLLDPDSLIYEDDDDYSDSYCYEMEEEQDEPDEYSMYQHLFDGKDIPTDVELSMDWLPKASDKETAKPSGSSKASGAENGIPPEASSSSSSEKPAKVSGAESQHSHIPTPVAQPWKALPHNSKGVIPNSAYALPQKPKSAQSVVHFLSQPQTPDTVMGEAPVPAPAPAPAPAQGPFGVMLPGHKNPFGWKSPRPTVAEVIAAKDTSRCKRNMEDYLGKYLFFKRFDSVEDCDDHQYAARGTTSKQHSKEWARRIQEEWRILENDLPEMIFVRAYESRMDLMRAVIIGAEGTPYHDGLFFFDIFFPDEYPSVPPYFENFSYGHFFSCAHDVLKACNAYRNGAPVGSLVKGVVNDVDDKSEKASSIKFRADVATFVETVLLKEFILLGVLGLEPEEEDNPSETDVAESSNSKRPRSERDGVSSS
ncbi:unnamed protein product [Thlaspi arvense]|uniref:UBC core domain-containing protein n=1 Tax=Thlaspi arvense TaxID=13288 RepID=A0AAU9RYK3_THLAR|nr:unnamed protein product [Thlaspi arvense]